MEKLSQVLFSSFGRLKIVPRFVTHVRSVLVRLHYDIGTWKHKAHVRHKGTVIRPVITEVKILSAGRKYSPDVSRLLPLRQWKMQLKEKTLESHFSNQNWLKIDTQCNLRVLGVIRPNEHALFVCRTRGRQTSQLSVLLFSLLWLQLLCGPGIRSRILYIW